MFTGIVEEMGRIRKIIGGSKKRRFEIEGKEVLEDLKVKNSININGACLTVIELKRKSFMVEAVEETLKRTNLGELKIGDRVNLERGLKLSDRLGGHIVLGHIDCVGRIKSIRRKENFWDFEIATHKEFLPYIVEKGSVAIEGVSLTVVFVGSFFFRVSIIPFTYQNTTFGKKKVSDKVNIEFDILGKYVEKILKKDKKNFTYDFLKEKGF